MHKSSSAGVPGNGSHAVASMLRLNADPVLTVEQAATYLNVRDSFIRDLNKQRRIETVKVGAHVRIRMSECDRILREGTRPATKPMNRRRFG